MIEGRAQVDQSIARTLWGTLFLCVPVISTTLASVSRLFSSLGKENIGWLLLDEAGQATPQSAAGMIWRSKRCIIVGDPLQIEPVVTIPQKLITKLRQQEGVDLTWSPSSSSVQILADRVSTKGTFMRTGESDEQVWTGFPLRTHRRCENPMFDIANEIAYSGQMVKATRDSDDKAAIRLHQRDFVLNLIWAKFVFQSLDAIWIFYHGELNFKMFVTFFKPRPKSASANQ